MHGLLMKAILPKTLAEVVWETEDRRHRFVEFPPRQKAASFTIDRAMEKLLEGISST